MGKNWLIRTKSNHILGPVSKEKVVELFKNGSIKQDDEICSGNGYWFYIRETDLVDKYLLGFNAQSFNPISEAKDVLTNTEVGRTYEGTRDDITMIGEIDLKNLRDASPEPKTEVASASPKNDPEGSQKKKVRIESQSKLSSIPRKPIKQNYLKYLGIFIFLVLFCAIYFRKTILRSFFHPSAYLRNISSLILNEAHAQNDSSGKKKSY